MFTRTAAGVVVVHCCWHCCRPQVDSLEQALLAALPLGPQAAAGGVSLPELFRVGVALLLMPCAQLWVPLCCVWICPTASC